MNIPAFTAESSLYRSGNSYRVSTTESNASLPADSIVLALSAEGWANCDACEKKCGRQYLECFFKPWSFFGVGCVADAWWCLAECHFEGEPCCPKDCGEYCCSFGEQCSHYSGCCPGDRVVCGGYCCSAGNSCCGNTCCNAGQACCGDTCCAPGQTCCDGTCCSGNCCGNTCCDAGVPCCGDRCCSFLPPPGTPPPPPPDNNCIFGGEPCVGKCCPIGTVCCGGSPGQPDCRPGSTINACLH
jgi:hypothetical protein